MRQLQRSWVQSQHPSGQWNLRGGRWSSAEYGMKKNKKIPPLKKKYLAYCITWTKRPLDIVSLTKPFLKWGWLILGWVWLGLIKEIWTLLQGPNGCWGDIILESPRYLYNPNCLVTTSSSMRSRIGTHWSGMISPRGWIVQRMQHPRILVQRHISQGYIVPASSL